MLPVSLLRRWSQPVLSIFVPLSRRWLLLHNLQSRRLRALRYYNITSRRETDEVSLLLYFPQVQGILLPFACTRVDMPRYWTALGNRRILPHTDSSIMEKCTIVSRKSMRVVVRREASICISPPFKVRHFMICSSPDNPQNFVVAYSIPTFMW